jgi:hypothetical protein
MDPAYLEHKRLAEAAMPGPYYTQVLAGIHQRVKPRNYLEIGVASGKTIVLARPETRAVGVDPQPKIGVPLGPNVTIVRATSDDFFARADAAALLGGTPLELAFIDGMHHFEYALRDFAYVERLADPRGTVLLHDCYPLDRLTAERERRTVFWSGDCWRLILALKKYRPDLSISTVAAAPTGLALVRRLDPASRVLAERMEAIVAEFLALDYGVLDADKAGMLNLVPNDAARLGELLDS